MGYGVGIDLGTSFTSAAVSGPFGTRMVPLGPDLIVPSVVRVAEDGTLVTGNAAAGPNPDPARVARGFKRRLGDPTPLMLGGAPYSVSTLMAAQLRDVLDTVTTWAGGERPESILLTCPAIWGPYRREHFAEVPRTAGVPSYRLLTEPEAAATHYSTERRLGNGEVVAVYDLGGGTFDTTILRMRDGEMEILGTPEGIEHLGGVDFDDALLSHVDDRLAGAVSALDPADPQDSAALAAIRIRCAAAKQELSVEPDVRITVPLPSGPREVLVTRLQFNDMIRSSIKQTTDALGRTIESAGLRPDDLSAVLLAGGSSRIPLVSQMVSEAFGKPVRVTLHPKFTVALGAAAVARAVPTSTPTSTAPGGPTAAAPVPPVPPAGQLTGAPSVPPVLPPVPPLVPGQPGSGGRSRAAGLLRSKRRRAVLAGAVVVVVAALVVSLTMLFGGGDPDGVQAAPRTTTSSVAQPVAPAPSSGQAPAVNGPKLVAFTNGKAVSPWTAYVSAQSQSWAPVVVGPDGVGHGSIKASDDGDGGVHLTWFDLAAQYYLQNTEPMDLRSYAGSGAALVFDVTVHKQTEGMAKVAVHCGYPCGPELQVTGLIRHIKPAQRTTVAIPISCFVDKGLDPAKVDTPFVFIAAKPFDATFFDIRWESGPAAHDAAVPCADVG